MDELVRYMRALLLLQLSDRLGGSPEKAELLLARAGFKVREIAELLGKSEAATAKTISRAKDAARKQGVNSDD